MGEHIFEIDVDGDNRGLVGATYRVLPDGRVQVESVEGSWTLPLELSRLLASAVLSVEADL